VFLVTADSNIYVSGFQFRGKPAQFLTVAAEGRIDLAITDHIIEEVSRTLRQKFDWPEERIEQAQRVMGRIARRVEPVQIVDVIKDDPTDNRIQECAVEAKSEYIVSGDRHLLRLKTFGNARIVKVAEFRDILKQGTEG
jgi:putative PIN family toxin of toxin-antitoxin system